MNVEKQGYLVKITNEQLREAYPIHLFAHPVLSQEERQRRQQEAHAKQVKEWEALQDQIPLLGPIIALHSPSEYGECQGCDGGPEYSGDWPCRTIELIQEGL